MANPATLADLQTIINDGGMKNRIVGALSRTAVNINNEGGAVTNHTARLAFAKTILTGDANAVAGQVVKYVIGAYNLANPGNDVSQILVMDDATLQSYVDASVNVFAGA